MRVCNHGGTCCTYCIIAATYSTLVTRTSISSRIIFYLPFSIALSSAFTRRAVLPHDVALDREVKDDASGTVSAVSVCKAC